jgi:recombinational DNA repair protein (RecF pathway)
METLLSRCTRCDRTIEKQQCYEHQGKILCEDCYMDTLSPPKACDPWAVHSAKTFLKGKDTLSTLTSLQSAIVQYVTESGGAALEDLMGALHLTEEELRREFASLRHMEIVKATKREGKIFYVLFS